MRPLRKLLLAPLALALLCLTHSAAQADPLILTLTNPVVTGAAPGSTVSFTGSLTNAGPPTVFLNGDGLTVAPPGATTDDTPFFLNAPLSLASGVSTGTIELFRLTIGPGVAPGTTFAGTFTVLGGNTPGTNNVLATQAFSVTVASARAAAVPEPATLLLLSTGLTGLVGAARVRRRARR